jgi:hypothetical protein
MGEAGRADGTVRLTVGRCDDSGGDDDRVAWPPVLDEIDADIPPECAVQPAHITRTAIAAARRIPRA